MYSIKLDIDECSRLNRLRDFLSVNDIRLVLFAETHGYIKEVPVERKILENVRPDFFLYEMLEERKLLSRADFRKFLDKPNEERFSFISTYKDLKPTISLAYEFGLPIIGCDIKNMNQDSVDWIKKKFSAKEGRELIEGRELRQARVINDYISKGLVFASLGAYHLRRGSITVKNLKCKKFVTVSPSFGGKKTSLISAAAMKKVDGYTVSLIDKG